jgi:EAL domain-containing protein (putative c-di-GMP-specific phosphodiesterase class I)
MLNGLACRFQVQYLPHRTEGGVVDGFYALQSGITQSAGDRVAIDLAAPASPLAKPAIAESVTEPSIGAEQAMFVDSFSEQMSGSDDAIGRIMTAIEQDEFRLFCQRISPLASGPTQFDHYEILIRLIEEEEGMMPPGAFFPLVEKYGLMPRLDRWVVQHVLEWASSRQENPERSFFINLAPATLRDPGFASFVREQLHEHRVPGSVLCFEITDSALSTQREEAAAFASQIRECGCLLALSGFGRDGISFEPLQGLKVDFIKIDGSIILHVLRDAMNLARVVAITRVARTIGIKTVAEFVESDECVAKLREVGVDFVQGFGISTPRPLAEIA